MTRASAVCPTCGCGSAAWTDPIAGHCPSCLIGLALSEEETPVAGIEPDDLTNSVAMGAEARRQFGDHLLGRQIGAGGMGVVYEARRLSDGRRVAIKLIRDAHVASPMSLRRFTIEAEAAARLDHPHIVRLLEIGECEGHPFLTMDLIEGENLDTYLARTGPDSPGPPGQRTAPQNAARLMASVARAVQHAHERGVLHRDLKPANILIDPQGQPHLTDFGLAKILQAESDESPGTATAALTTSGVPGTPSYLSPEQVSGAPAGPAADLYGLGAVLYALLTGRPPFAAATPLELYRQIARQPPARPRSLNRSIPADLETICLKCLAKHPRDRYATAGALAEDLDRFLAGSAIHARPVSSVRRTWHWTRRNPIGTALIASLCLGLSVALALLKVVNDQRREMELDRDQVFDEGMQKVSQIWSDPATHSVTISARELAILAGRTPSDSRDAHRQFVLGVAANDGPSSMAQRYAHLLGNVQEQLGQALGEKVAFHLRLLKRFHQHKETLLRGEVDFLVMNAVDFLRAQQENSNIVAVARANTVRGDVLFARANTGIRQLADLRGRTLALPNLDRSSGLWARARLVDAGLHRRDLGRNTSAVSSGSEAGAFDGIDQVLRGECDAGVAPRNQFERHQHRGLVLIEVLPEAPDVLAARPGLAPPAIRALQTVLATPRGAESWPDSKFVVEPDSTGAHSLQALRAILEKASQF